MKVLLRFRSYCSPDLLARSSVFNGLEQKVTAKAAVEILFGFGVTVNLSVALSTTWEIIMNSSIVFMAYVWCEVAFLRGLVGQTSIQTRDNRMWKLLPHQESARRFDSFAPHQFNGPPSAAA